MTNALITAVSAAFVRPYDASESLLASGHTFEAALAIARQAACLADLTDSCPASARTVLGADASTIAPRAV